MWRRGRLQRAALALALLAGVALLAGCGGTAAGGASYAPAVNGPLNSGASHSAAGGNTASGIGAPVATPAAGAGSSGSVTKTSTQSIGLYLIKSLTVSMVVPNTTAAASDLESWISVTDPQSQSAGANYTLDGDSYDITLTFSVAASRYTQVENYLKSYPAAHKGKLIGLQEAVQDVTNDYVDTQSQLANLRVEQARLRTLMSQAGSLADLLAVEQRLSDVEGQIEQIEGHLNQLNGATTFYTMQIQLTPIATYKPPVTQPWSPSAIFHQALSSAQGFGEGLLTLAIWLLVYAIYIVPLLIIIWLARRVWLRRTARRAAPATVAAPTPTAPAD
ncbi:MAG: DUF4349 domain-containing protein [Chloroflexota bacterium]|nr:DUF4349 domain-containing protein [Chloroflexota bacterium]